MTALHKSQYTSHLDKAEIMTVGYNNSLLDVFEVRRNPPLANTFYLPEA